MSVAPIETDRLLIRNFTPDDGEPLREMIVQYEASDVGAYDHKWPSDPDEVRGVAKWFAGGDSYLAVCLKDSGRFIGFVALNGEGEGPGRQLGLGYVFNFDYHGRGYATEACSSVLRYAFDALQAAAIVTGTADANLPSVRLLTRLGFQQGEAGRGSFQNDANGQPIMFDGHEYKLTREEWSAAHPELPG